jgi:predicted metal-binding membrane protein
MIASVHAGRAESGGLAPAFAAVRARVGLIALLVGLTALAWWSTADRMAGMDAGPGTDLGALGWFVGVWVVMMAGMMFPSLAPTVALYGRMTRSRGLTRPLLFAGGYLLVWGAAGLAAYGLFRLGRTALGGDLAWNEGGRYFAGGVLVLAAVYELTPLKDVCLGKCRSPLGFLLGSWRDGRYGALEMGSKHAAWCVGCCWALMAGLFALGVMSLTWMALVTALIALEKVLPWRRVATWGTAAVLLVLGIALMAAPRDLPGLVVPGSHGAMQAMSAMHAMPAKHGTPGMHTMPAKHAMPGTHAMPAKHATPAMRPMH